VNNDSIGQKGFYPPEGAKPVEFSVEGVSSPVWRWRMSRLISPFAWLSQEVTRPPSIIQELIPAQPGEFFIISGRTGIGKSILMNNTLFIVGTGTPFYGGHISVPTDVGLLMMEGDRSNLEDRMRKTLMQYPASNRIKFDFRLGTKPLEDNLDYYKDTFRGCKLILLDNLSQMTTSDRLKPDYASYWLNIWQEFLRDMEAVGGFTMHIKKPNENSLFNPGDVYSLKGATEYVDTAATVFLLERKRQTQNMAGRFAPVNQEELILYFAKQRLAQDRTLPPISLRKNFATAGFVVVEQGV